jgi:hypothetical protein
MPFTCAPLGLCLQGLLAVYYILGWTLTAPEGLSYPLHHLGRTTCLLLAGLILAGKTQRSFPIILAPRRIPPALAAPWALCLIRPGFLNPSLALAGLPTPQVFSSEGLHHHSDCPTWAWSHTTLSNVKGLYLLAETPAISRQPYSKPRLTLSQIYKRSLSTECSMLRPCPRRFLIRGFAPILHLSYVPSCGVSKCVALSLLRCRRQDLTVRGWLLASHGGYATSRGCKV